MRLHRFYVEQSLGEEIVIHKKELIQQWTKVFRYKEKDLVILFDGKGYDVVYALQTLSQKEAVLVMKEKSPSYIPLKKVTLCVSLVKKDTFELILQKATELGVSTIIPILSERSEKKNLRMERLQTIAIESAEQCGRGDIPQILDITTLSEAFSHTQTSSFSFVGDTSEEKDTLRSNNIQKKIAAADTVNIFIGPEGGWTEKERVLFKKHEVMSVSFGNTVLRAETAAIVACAYTCS